MRIFGKSLQRTYWISSWWILLTWVCPLQAWAESTGLPEALQSILPQKGQEHSPSHPLKNDPLGDLPDELDVAPSPSSSSAVTPPIQAFIPESHPGRGLLRWSVGESQEEIILGLAAGHYGMGLVYENSQLSPAHQNEFGKLDMIHLSFGNLASQRGSKVAEFLQTSILTQGFFTEKKTFEIRGSKIPSKPHESALLMMLSAEAEGEQSDEQRLKSTFFGKQGKVAMTPHGAIGLVEFEEAGKVLKFKWQNMVIKYEAELSTPFSSQKGELKGIVEVPLYWTANEAARQKVYGALLRSLSSNGVGPASAP